MNLDGDDSSNLDFGNDGPTVDTKETTPVKEPEVKEKDLLSKDDDQTETEETPEEKAEREAAEAKAEANRRIRIPKARFDEAQQKARAREEALQQKILELERAQGVQHQSVEVSKAQKQLDELQDKYEDLVMDGKKDEAKAVRRQVEQLRDQLTDYKTTVKSEAARKAAIDDLRFDSLLAKAESTYPVLNPENDQFDRAKTEEVADLMEAFQAKGFTRAAALEKAIKYVMGPAQSALPLGDETTAALRAKRAEDARKKAAEADKKQPASTSKVGLNSDAAGSRDTPGIDIMRMSQDKFAKIDEDTLSKLRGDTL